MPMTPQQMGDAIIRNLPAKTGRTLEEWIDLVRTQGPATRKERTQWLKSVHGLGHVQAQVVAGEADKARWYTEAPPQELIDAQYAGAKEHLRPIYERLVSEVQALGDDARIDARKTYASLARRRQFGIIQASTKSRVDLGLRLDGAEPGERLLAAGSFGSGQVTHRIAIFSVEEVDREVTGWLRDAYEHAG